MIFYEVWDKTSGNLLGSYRSEAKALTLVRSIVERADSAEAENLVLVSGDDEDEDYGGPVVEGRALLVLAQPARAMRQRPYDPACGTSAVNARAARRSAGCQFSVRLCLPCALAPGPPQLPGSLVLSCAPSSGSRRN